MHKPRRNIFVYRFFAWYIGRIIRADFSRFKYNPVAVSESRSILLLANHFSWWDGFWMFHLNRLHFKKKFHVIVSEDNFRKVWFLKYMGAVPLKRRSRSMIKTLEYAGTLLDDPDNLVLIFPQGKLFSMHVHSVHFEKGLLNLINSSAKKFQYLFAANFVDYLANRKPALTCFLQEWDAEHFTSLQMIRDAYHKHYETSRQHSSRITV